MTTIEFDGQSVLTLNDTHAELLVAPQYGARLLRWTVDGQPVIFWPEHADWAHAARVRGGNPILFPFVGRHFVDGEIGHWRDAQGQVYDLPLHGFARDLPFEAHLDAASRTIRMTLADTPQTRAVYPFAFRFEVVYRLAGRSLVAEFITHNTGDTPLPYYPGHHFYFALPAHMRGETLLSLPPTRRQFQTPDGTPAAPVPGASSYRLDDAAIMDRFHVLEAGGPVELRTPSLHRTIRFDLDSAGIVDGSSHAAGDPASVDAAWYAVTTWTERPDADFYCVEPWLGLPDAIHHGQGLRWIAPGASERAALRITVEHANNDHPSAA